MTVDSLLGFGDLFLDAAQCAPCPVMAELVVDDAVWDTSGLLATGGRLRLGQHQLIRNLLLGVLVAPLADHIRQKRDPATDSSCCRHRQSTHWWDFRSPSSPLNARCLDDREETKPPLRVHARSAKNQHILVVVPASLDVAKDPQVSAWFQQAQHPVRSYESDPVSFLLIEVPLQEIAGAVNVSKPGSSYTLSGYLVILALDVYRLLGRLTVIGESPGRVITAMPESDNERLTKLIVSKNEASGRCVRSEPQNIKSNFSLKSTSLTLTRD
jgi:hypothetical protein